MNAKCELSHIAAVHLARICENSDPASPQGNKNVEPTGRRPAGDMAPTKFQIHLYSAARTVRQQKASFALPWQMANACEGHCLGEFCHCAQQQRRVKQNYWRTDQTAKCFCLTSFLVVRHMYLQFQGQAAFQQRLGQSVGSVQCAEDVHPLTRTGEIRIKKSIS